MDGLDFVIVIGGLIATYLLGSWQGFMLGKCRRISRTEAARVLAEASNSSSLRKKRTLWNIPK